MELVITQTQRFGTSFKAWLVKVFNAFIEGRQKEADRRIASMQLHGMTDKDLRDIGITRGDISRIIDEETKMR
jgi:uncharacterized protein YjiS (DUF1127 family)